ncbi:tRNA (mo5U34)-methyltransferase [Stieleria bergensis]|uniref:tRNA (Mo5U34)-methyltransferase n=1 Tax=Stieleria bergensis TaxID=2528025 RepID=A0A517SN25_9BACT|nr:tRNA (mo5U34)-methyltransferase [Planctomycetes bacterium SV_7m_r]
MNTEEQVNQRPAELIAAADNRLVWEWKTTEIAGQEWPMAVASDPDAMLVEACERQDAGEKDVIDPFWATTWRAASGLDRFLERLDVQGKRVLELGCGTGHVGIAAAIRGANVVLTDGVEDPLHLVRLSSYPLRERCQVQRLRFGIDQLTERFPVIVGSDVTYLRELWPQLMQTVDQHLADGGQLLLSDPFRIIAREFRDWLSDQQWQYEEHQIEMPDDRKHPIRIMQIKRQR